MGAATVSAGGGFGTLLFLVFLALKLTGHVSWSWWLVTAPLWGPWAVGVVLSIAVGAGYLAYKAVLR